MDTIVVVVPKDSIKEFLLNDMAILIVHMHQISNKFFLPTAVSPSVNNPEKDLMLLMCNTSKINERSGPLKFEKQLISAVDIARTC